jgi:hypothetical protein
VQIPQLLGKFGISCRLNDGTNITKPVNNWCNIGNLQITNVTNKRDVFQSWEEMAKLY